MASWQQFVVIFKVGGSIGSKPGLVVYPSALQGQDINAVLDQYGQQSFEVSKIEVTEYDAVMILKKPVTA